MQLQPKVTDEVHFDPSVINTMSSIGSPINQGSASSLYLKAREIVLTGGGRRWRLFRSFVVQGVRDSGLECFMQIYHRPSVSAVFDHVQFSHVAIARFNELYQDAPKLENALSCFSAIRRCQSTCGEEPAA